MEDTELAAICNRGVSARCFAMQNSDLISSVFSIAKQRSLYLNEWMTIKI